MSTNNSKTLIIRKASAGSGKTFQLARHYIIDMLSVCDESTGKLKLNTNPIEAHSHILAITFTNKATNEMKQRIVKELARLAYVNPSTGEYARSDHRDAIRQALNCSDADLQKASSIALRSLLFSYHHFNVSTIDSFFQLVMRTFAREVDRPGDYSVEVDDKEAISVAVQNMLDRAKRAMVLSEKSRSKEDAALLRLIKEFTASKFEEGHKFNIFNRNNRDLSTLTNAIADLLDEDLKLNVEMREYLNRPDADVALSTFARLVKEAADKCEQGIIDTAKAFRQKAAVYDDNGADNNSKNVFIKLADGDLSQFKNNTIKNLRKGDKTYFKKNNGVQEIEDYMKECLTNIYKHYSLFHTVSAISDNIVTLQFLQAVLTDIKNYRDDNNLILLSDTAEILRTLINDEELPFIYEKLGTRLNHFLLDEFQDTSRMQWENLRPLIGNGISGGDSSLIIGDEKQSIYRFRNADYKLLYKEAQSDFQKFADVIAGEDPANNTNWRSAADIIRFNNTFFREYSSQSSERTRDIYKYVEQAIPSGKESRRGLVVMRAIKNDKKGESLTKDDFVQESLQRLIADLKACREDGYGWGDIAILTDTRAEGDMVIEHLMKYRQDYPDEVAFNELTVVSEESLSISRADSVRFAISVLRMLDPTSLDNSGRAGEFSVAEITTRYEYFLLKAREENKKDYDRILSDSLNVTADNWNPQTLIDKYGNNGCTSLITLVEQIISDNVPPKIRKEEYVYIHAFIDAVTRLSASGISSIHSFLTWWDEWGRDESIELPSGEGADAMTVMTIHKSKGLEFPCVIIPFASWETNKQDKYSWYTSDVAKQALISFGIPDDIIPPMLPIENKNDLQNTLFKVQYEENTVAYELDGINKAYVAFTRAVSRLIVTYCPEYKKDGFHKRISSILESFSDDVIECLKAVNEQDFISYYGDVNSVNVKVEKEFDQFDMRPIDTKNKADYSIDTYEAIEVNHSWQLLSSDDDLPNPAEAKNQGRILHAVMRAVRSLADVDKIKTILLRKTFRQCLSDRTIDDYAKKLSKALSREDVSRWFVGFKRLISERTIAVSETKKRRDGSTYTVLNRRPDRVVVLSDGTVEIIDYKFGERNDERYSRQVREYVDLYRSMGFDNVKGYVWYVLDPTEKAVLHVNPE